MIVRLGSEWVVNLAELQTARRTGDTATIQMKGQSMCWNVYGLSREDWAEFVAAAERYGAARQTWRDDRPPML